MWLLLEDGRRRDFTGFEAPSEHPSLELVVMVDVTDVQRGGFWSAKALHELASVWNEATVRAIVEEQGAGVRVSLYQFSETRLRRLTRSTSDPKVLLEALRRLSDPIPADPALNLTLPAGTAIRSERPNLGHWPLSLTGAMAALQDSALGLAMGARALVIISTGAEGTSIRPEDLADQALSADIHVYPVALPTYQAIWYDGDNPNVQWENRGASGPSQMVTPRMGEFGICQDALREGSRQGGPPLDADLLDCPLNAPFKAIGTWTGGRSFEAARRPGPKMPHTGSESMLSRFSMTGAQVINILDAVKEHALARFTATYRVWFTPSPSVWPRKHTLEVKLAPKTSGTVSDGKKSATY
ncbi:MAG: hypothetical protein ACRD3G_05005 [Vicinamibacterales bacterium]